MNRLDVLNVARGLLRDRQHVYDRHPKYVQGWNEALEEVIQELDLTGTRGSGRLARASDPPSSHEGARRIEPKRGTRKAEVLSKLLADPYTWIPAEELHTASCGGSDGLRRVRELRNMGWDIEVRYLEGSMTEYRITTEQLTLV